MKYMANPNLGVGSEYTDRLNRHASALHRLNAIEHRPELFVHRSMIGGGRFREDVLPGQNGSYPLDAARLEEYKRMGGAFSLGKTIRQVKDAIPASVRRKAYTAAKAAARPVVERYAARAGLEELVPVGERELDRVVGGINRFRKAKKWTGFAAETVSKGLDLGAKAKSLLGYGMEGDRVGGINRFRKAKKWTNYSAETLSKGLDLGAKAKSLFGYGMDGGGTRKDLPAGAAATKAHMAKLREGQGRAEIFVRGSDAAREHMAGLRAKRRTKAELDAERAAGREAAGMSPRKARPPSARAAIVKEIMRSEGLSMIEASKFVKANGLYTPK